ncbi:glycoside hydrolase superfamily [Alternaria rosae]|uniref:glycoside hydrolase superfamily n=1 Tax=Alternaria rosae TaxID=1187941 RepID=UPI001E8E0CC5|nr:glycoside hydrolase superfamily [Alternaria rosae]KAH6882791.1 glycoside hydrolase superfamily [Alternaria rosae]
MPPAPPPSYPRPDFLREDLTWMPLNGPWSFLFDDNDVGLTQGWHLTSLPDKITVNPTNTNSAENTEAHSITAKIAAGTQELLQGNSFKNEHTVHEKRNIQVPYVFQCPASGIGEKGVHEVLWYERVIADPRTMEEKAAGNRVVLRFGAVDYEAKIWLNGRFFGGHRGGHVPFDVDVTDAFTEEKAQRLTIRVFDSAHDLTQPRGKQYWKAQPESIFYTPSGGIWQSVWLESVPVVTIGDASAGTLFKSNDIETGKLEASIKILGRPAGHAYSVEIEASLAGVSVSKTEKVTLPRDSDTVSLSTNMRLSDSQTEQLPESLTSTAPLSDATAWLNNLALWSPEHPTLYDLTICLYDNENKVIDQVHTTTGMRSLHWDNSTFRLNNRPYFQAFFLDQGYWPETFMTPPSSDALKLDIELTKKMGFNGCRKHQKVEDPLFHYWADRLGLLVWGEMANAYAFSEAYVERMDQEWREAVLRDRNHPCVVAWTPVNESWAYTDLHTSKQQRDHIRSLYYATKVLDATRPINDNCGWEHVITDLTTFHDYADADELTKTCSTLDGIMKKQSNRPTFLAPIESLSDPGSKHTPGAPVICTEFGGVNIARSAAGEEDRKRDWGYTTATDPKDLLKRIEKMMVGIVDGGHCCGFVYTQLTDIEQEVNGVYTPDRKEKLDAAEVKKVVERVMEKYAQMHK